MPRDDGKCSIWLAAQGRPSGWVDFWDRASVLRSRPHGDLQAEGAVPTKAWGRKELTEPEKELEDQCGSSGTQMGDGSKVRQQPYHVGLCSPWRELGFYWKAAGSSADQWHDPVLKKPPWNLYLRVLSGWSQVQVEVMVTLEIMM